MKLFQMVLVLVLLVIVSGCLQGGPAVSYRVVKEGDEIVLKPVYRPQVIYVAPPTQSWPPPQRFIFLDGDVNPYGAVGNSYYYNDYKQYSRHHHYHYRSSGSPVYVTPAPSRREIEGLLPR